MAIIAFLCYGFGILCRLMAVYQLLYSDIKSNNMNLYPTITTNVLTHIQTRWIFIVQSLNVKLSTIRDR